MFPCWRQRGVTSRCPTSRPFRSSSPPRSCAFVPTTSNGSFSRASLPSSPVDSSSASILGATWPRGTIASRRICSSYFIARCCAPVSSSCAPGVGIFRVFRPSVRTRFPCHITRSFRLSRPSILGIAVGVRRRGEFHVTIWQSFTIHVLRSRHPIRAPSPNSREQRARSESPPT